MEQFSTFHHTHTHTHSHTLALQQAVEPLQSSGIAYIGNRSHAARANDRDFADVQSRFEVMHGVSMLNGHYRAVLCRHVGCQGTKNTIFQKLFMHQMSDLDSGPEENEAQPQPIEAPKPIPKKSTVPPATGHDLHAVSTSSFVPILSIEERAKMQKEMRELQMAVTSRSLSVYIEEGRAAQVERILCNNGGPGSVMNSRLPCGEYPLTLALRCKQWGIVDLLLQQEHINMNVVGIGGESALLMAVKEAEASRFIRPMIAKGAKMDATDAHGNGIMDICIRSLNYVTMQLLVSIGLKVNFSSHWAPLWMFAAVAQDDSSCLKVLLQQLAVPTLSNTSGIPVLLDAIARQAIRYSFLHIFLVSSIKIAPSNST